MVEDTHDLVVAWWAGLYGMDDGERKLAFCQILTITLVSLILPSHISPKQFKWQSFHLNKIQVMFNNLMITNESLAHSLLCKNLMHLATPYINWFSWIVLQPYLMANCDLQFLKTCNTNMWLIMTHLQNWNILCITAICLSNTTQT